MKIICTVVNKYKTNLFKKSKFDADLLVSRALGRSQLATKNTVVTQVTHEIEFIFSAELITSSMRPSCANQTLDQKIAIPVRQSAHGTGDLRGTGRTLGVVSMPFSIHSRRPIATINA